MVQATFNHPIEGRITTTLASKRRALELGASFIEHDLAQLRADVRHHKGAASHSVENDVMKAMEWASAATWLRAMAEREDK